MAWPSSEDCRVFILLAQLSGKHLFAGKTVHLLTDTYNYVDKKKTFGTVRLSKLHCYYIVHILTWLLEINHCLPKVFIGTHFALY